jgi:hypothetical protein
MLFVRSSNTNMRLSLGGIALLIEIECFKHPIGEVCCGLERIRLGGDVSHL